MFAETDRKETEIECKKRAIVHREQKMMVKTQRQQETYLSNVFQIVCGIDTIFG